MSAEPNIRERLFDLCVGHGEWHIRKGDGICMTFSHSDSLDPEREAIAWLAEHQERYPERFAGYEVHRVTVQSELQLAALAVLDELDRLRATPAPGAPAGFKPVPIKVTKAMQDAWDSAPSSEDSDADFAGAYQAMLDAAPGAPGQEAAEPPFGTNRAAALALYRPPFRFTHGYIYDAANHMVADQDGFEGAVETHIAARVRGWGRIGYLPDAAALQDEVGQVIADALTAYWAGAGEKTS